MKSVLAQISQSHEVVRMQIVKWSEVSEVLKPSDLGIKEGYEVVSVNLAKKRAVVKKDGEYFFVGLTDEEVKLVKKARGAEQ